MKYLISRKLISIIWQKKITEFQFVIDSRNRYRKNVLTLYVRHELWYDVILIVTSRIVYCNEFSAVRFCKNTYPSCDGLAEVINAIFQGKDADICQVIILQNVNLTWVGTFIILNSLE
jgi:hypothetical protein